MKNLPFMGIVLVANLALMPAAHAEKEGFWSWLFSFESKSGVAPVSNDNWAEECGACHFAYPPGLLPAASWDKILNAKALSDHFGENAELDEDVRQELLGYALENSAEQTLYKRSRKILASLHDDKAPMRITQVPYIKLKHHEVVEEYIGPGKAVSSQSYCNKCHEKAEQGIFDEDTVYIPGVGRYDD